MQYLIAVSNGALSKASLDEFVAELRKFLADFFENPNRAPIIEAFSKNVKGNPSADPNGKPSKKHSQRK
jgi:hypothetical protein